MNEQFLHIYPNHKNYYTNELKRLENEEISRQNKDLITRFHEHLFSKGDKEFRVSKLSSQMRWVCHQLNIDLDLINKNDLVKLYATCNQKQNWAEATRRDYKRVIKQFYLWFEDEDPRLKSSKKTLRNEAHEAYKFIKKTKIGEQLPKIDKGSIITDEDIITVINKGCKQIKEKALIRFLHETGARASELLSMRIKDIEFKKNNALVQLDGKTGQRTIPITQSVKYIRMWLEVHPFNSASNSFVWLSESNTNRNNPIGHQAAFKLVHRCFKRASLGHRKHNLHWFRHSRATLLAPKLTEVMLCDFMGWERGSRMVRVYVHLCPANLEDIYLKMQGIKKENEEETTTISCQCGESNPPETRYCGRCGNPLSVEIAIQDQELVNSEINKTVQFMMELTNNPKLWKKFQEYKNKQT